MIDQKTIIKIHSLYDQGHSQQKISQELKISPVTVGKYLKYPIKAKRKTTIRSSKLEPFFTEIDKYIDSYPGASAPAIFDHIRSNGFNGGLTIVSDYVNQKAGKILYRNRKAIYFNKVKAELFKCMVKGISYENAINILLEKKNFDYKLALNKEERESIIKTGKGGNHKLWRYCVAIDMKAAGLHERTIMHVLDIHRGTLKKIWSKFNSKRLDGVQERRKPENSVKKERVKQKTERIIEIIHQSPQFFGLNRSCWTKASIAKVYEKEYCEKISESTIGDRLKNTGYSLKKARSTLTSSDPDYREKVETLLKVLHSLNSDDMFYFIDEVGPLRVKKYGGRSYTKEGEYKKVPQNQGSKGSIIFSAALSATTNQISWAYGNSKDTFSMIDLIEILFNQNYGKRKIYITWDAASWHSSNKLIEWLNSFNYETKRIGDGPEIIFVPLPNNAQFLNIIESVFSGMKRAVIQNKKGLPYSRPI